MAMAIGMVDVFFCILIVVAIGMVMVMVDIMFFHVGGDVRWWICSFALMVMAIGMGMGMVDVFFRGNE